MVEMGTRSTAVRVAAVGFGLALLVFCLVLGLLASQAMGGTPVSDVPVASPAPLATLTDALPTANASPFVLVPFPTTTRIVTITPPKPRTSTTRARSAASPTPTKYKVKAGDTLSSIAQKYKVTQEAIIKANGLKSEALSVGQQLIIPPSNR